MACKLVCGLLMVVTYVQAATLVKRQVFPPPPALGPGVPRLGEDPMERSEVGDGGVTHPTMANLLNPPFGNQLRNTPFGAVTPNPLEDFGEPSEFGDGGVTYPFSGPVPAAPRTPAQVPANPPAAMPIGFQAFLEAFVAWQAQQAAVPPSQPARTPAAQAPAAAPAPVNPAPPPVDAAPQGAAAVGAPPANPGQSSVFVVPGQQFGGTV